MITGHTARDGSVLITIYYRCLLSALPGMQIKCHAVINHVLRLLLCTTSELPLLSGMHACDAIKFVIVNSGAVGLCVRGDWQHKALMSPTRAVTLH